VFLFGQGGDNGGNNGIVTTGTQTPGAGGQVAGLGVKSIATATVREGPGLDYLELGLLRNKQDVQVVGRNEDASWYQIVFPRDSQLRGWVPDSALDLSDSAAQALAVVQVTPITRPTVAIPTPTPRPPDPTPSATATPEGGGDKVDIGVVIAADCSPNTDIVLLLTNAGNAHIKNKVEVLVSNNGTVVYDEDMDADLAPGQTATVNTRVKAKAPSMTATVLLKGAQDVSAANNITSCSVSGGGGGGNGGNNGNGNGNGNNNGGTSVPPPVGTQTDDDN
jgi:uncharacterized protein YgiM (DUF1202 family)